MIKMIIAPLVFATLAVGIASMGDSKTIGRVGAKTFGWFLMMSFLSLLLGLLMVHLLQPGAGVNLEVPAASASTGWPHRGTHWLIFCTMCFRSALLTRWQKRDSADRCVCGVLWLGGGTSGPQG